RCEHFRRRRAVTARAKTPRERPRSGIQSQKSRSWHRERGPRSRSCHWAIRQVGEAEFARILAAISVVWWGSPGGRVGRSNGGRLEMRLLQEGPPRDQRALTGGYLRAGGGTQVEGRAGREELA